MLVQGGESVAAVAGRAHAHTFHMGSGRGLRIFNYRR